MIGIPTQAQKPAYFSYPLLQRFEKVAALPKDEKDAILLLIDSVIAKHTIREVMGS